MTLCLNKCRLHVKTVYFFNGSIFPMGMLLFLQKAWGKHWRAYTGEQSGPSSYKNFINSFNYHYYSSMNHIQLKVRGVGKVSCRKKGKV